MSAELSIDGDLNLVAEVDARELNNIKSCFTYHGPPYKGFRIVPVRKTIRRSFDAKDIFTIVMLYFGDLYDYSRVRRSAKEVGRMLSL